MILTEQPYPSPRSSMVAIFLYAASLIKFFDRDPLSPQVGPQGPIELAVLVVVALALLVTVRRHSLSVWVPPSAKAFLMFGVIAAVSAPFSFYPTLSFAKALAFILTCAVAILASNASRPAQILKYLYYSIVIILAIDLAVKVAGGGALMDLDDYSGRERLFLFGMYPTSLGQLSSFTMLSGFLLTRRPPLYCQAFLFVMAILSGSRTGTTLLLIAVLGILLASIRFNPKVVSLACGLACGLVVLLLVGSQINDHLSVEVGSLIRPLYGDMPGQEVSTLNGRTDVWDAAAPALAHCFFLGYGLGGARDVLVNNTSKHWVAGDAHNAYVEIALGAGFPAAFICLFGWAGAARRAWQSPGSLRIGAIAVYAFIAGYGVVAPDLTDLQGLATFLIITVDALVGEQLAVSRGQALLANLAAPNRQAFESPAGA
jgi:O-antigen ligase